MSIKNSKPTPVVTHFLEQGTTPNSTTPYECIRANYIQTTTDAFEDYVSQITFFL